MQTHPFQPDPKRIPAMTMCAICGKPRTNIMHDGEGEIEPPEDDEQQMSAEEEQALIAEQIRRNREARAAQQQPQQQQDEPMPTNFFSIRAAEQGTEVILVVPGDIPNEQVLGAVIAFMEAVKPVEAPPEPKKKR